MIDMKLIKKYCNDNPHCDEKCVFHGEENVIPCLLSAIPMLMDLRVLNSRYKKMLKQMGET